MNCMELYERWASRELEDQDLTRELEEIRGKQEEIYDRFYKDLEFGTAGLRGIIGAGSNRMNIYTVRKATQGLAMMLKENNKAPMAAVSYDSRIKSDVFAKEAARVLAANGIKVWLYPQLMPVPALAFATRDLKCQAGIMVTASHNPSKYNGYKVYGPDGCQLGLEESARVLDFANKTDLFDDVKITDFDAAVKSGMIEYIEEKIVDHFIAAVEKQQINPGICKKAGLKLVYTPLNGAGNHCVRRVLKNIGVTDITVVPEQEHPDGNFPTCPYPNPEIKEALAKGLELCAKTGADLLLATDPDCDRVGIAVRQGDEYELLSGNQVGALLLDYIAAGRIANHTMPKDPVAVTTIVSTKLFSALGSNYGVDVKIVLTGCKFIGEQIHLLEEEGHPERYIFGFEESYGYLAGTHVRDKDAVVGSMLIVEMASYYKEKGMTLVDALKSLYERFGLYCESVANFMFEGAQGMTIMTQMMDKMRKNPPKELAGSKVICVKDYLASISSSETGVEPIALPKSNVLEYLLENGCSAVVRPSGTEPKIKLYLSIVGEKMSEIEPKAKALSQDIEKMMGVK